MKSAWMLTAVTGFVLVATVSGCVQPSWGISPPVGLSHSGPVAPGASAQAPASSADKAKPQATSMPSDADPSVAELTRKIEALASRTPAPPAAVPPTTQPVVITPVTLAPTAAAAPPPVSVPRAAAPAPALVQVAPAAPAVAARPDPGPLSTPVAAVATQPAPVNPPVANAPTVPSDNDQKSATTSTEMAASPTPRPMPIIQPSMVTPPPPAVSPAATVEITNIRPVIAPGSVDPNASLATANQPARAEQAAPTTSLERVVTQMEQAIQQRPPHPEDELRLRLLYLAAGMDGKVAEPVKGMDPIQSELLNAIVKAVASSRKAMLEPANASPSALAATEELRRLLGQQSGVSIPRIALVTKVASYGDYEAISPLRFKAGAEITAYVYTEVANFRSEPVEGDRLRTLLGERVQVFDSSGKVIWERHENNIEDRVRSPRRDFFIPFPMKLPATLVAGEYVVKVTIEDRVGGTTDQQRLSFSIQ